MQKDNTSLFRLMLWLYYTQRNGKGPVKYLGLTSLDWIVICCVSVLTASFFAIKLYYRRLRKGRHGYLVSRRSYYGWFPHFMYGRHRINGTCQLVGFVPANPKHKRLPPPLFRGKVKWGD